MKLAITTTVPTEVLLAGGHIPVDLNNIFITGTDPMGFIDYAHSDGFPRSLCAWIKAQYSIVSSQHFDAVIAVTTGDCSNTHAMIELLEDKKIPVFRFAYPTQNNSEHSYAEMKIQIERLATFLGTTMPEIEAQFNKMHGLRRKLAKLDELTTSGYVTGGENHLWLVSTSDFNGDMTRFEQELDTFLASAELREPINYPIRLGYIGVPPIITDLYDFAENKDAGFCFNEVQRQFTIPSPSEDIIRRYLDYTYPYDIFSRIKDIAAETASRRLDGIVHYVQSFCHRQVQDILLKKHLNVPILTIEGDAPGKLDERSKIRMESFIEMLQERKACT